MYALVKALTACMSTGIISFKVAFSRDNFVIVAIVFVISRWPSISRAEALSYDSRAASRFPRV